MNVDKFPTFAPDVVWDLERFPWPFLDDSCAEIVLHHVLEHLGASVETFFGIMKELYRISAPEATIRIDVPHPRGDGFAGDPTHVRPITPVILGLFSRRNNLEWQRLGWPNTPLGLYLDVDFEVASAEYQLMPRWQARLDSGELTTEQVREAIETYYNVVDEIRMVVRAKKSRLAAGGQG